MTQEEKAKAYDEALERAREIKRTYPQDKVCETIFQELKESEDEKIRKWLIGYFHQYKEDGMEKYANGLKVESIIDWLEKQGESYTKRDVDDAWLKGMCDAKRELEKQGEQKPTQEIEPFEAEHGKYYYCIKDYFCGGRKQASKGDVVQALRGLPIMGLKDAGEYFLPVNSIKCNSAWSEEDEKMLVDAYVMLDWYKGNNWWTARRIKDWLKSLKTRYTWKPSDEQIEILDMVLTNESLDDNIARILRELREQLKKLKER